MHSILNNYKIILESIEEGVFTVNMEFRIMSFNRAAEKITGVSKKDAIGAPCCDIFKANICGEKCILRKTMKSGVPNANIPIYIYQKNGKRIPISVNTAVLKATNGKVIGGVEIFKDLTAFNELQKAYFKQHSFEDIVSKNQKMLKYFSILPQIAESDSTILIEGPTGTGKELFARAIHNNSTQKNGPFISVNCGALPDTLIESELFGYKAGAFTDAKKDKKGRFALAQDGTIFLDEIGDISQALQVRLLRVLQEKTYEPLGAQTSIRSNARVLTATNRNLEKLARENHFRQDLYYRINVIKLLLPPLVERKEDIPLLTNHFIEKFNYTKGKHIVGLTQEAMTTFMIYDWPGNIRELENTIEHAFVLCRKDLIEISDLPEHFQPEVKTYMSKAILTLSDIEKQAIYNALTKNNWKKMITAKELGIDKNTLRRKIKRYNLIQSNS